MLVLQGMVLNNQAYTAAWIARSASAAQRGEPVEPGNLGVNPSIICRAGCMVRKPAARVAFCLQEGRRLCCAAPLPPALLSPLCSASPSRHVHQLLHAGLLRRHRRGWGWGWGSYWVLTGFPQRPARSWRSCSQSSTKAGFAACCTPRLRTPRTDRAYRGVSCSAASPHFQSHLFWVPLLPPRWPGNVYRGSLLLQSAGSTATLHQLNDTAYAVLGSASVDVSLLLPNGSSPGKAHADAVVSRRMLCHAVFRHARGDDSSRALLRRAALQGSAAAPVPCRRG